MALISLLFQQRAKIGVLELDCSLSETHEAPARVTEIEIESGASINDHIILQPLKLTLNGIVSKTPLGAAGLLGSIATAGATQAAKNISSKFGHKAGASALAAGASLGGLIAGKLADGFTGSRAPRDVFDYLMQLRDERKAFDVVTALKLYSNMVISNLSVPRNKDTVNTLEFTVTLQQLTIVAPLIEFNALAGLGGVAGASPSSNLGKQTGVAPAEKTYNGSLGIKALIGAGVAQPLPQFGG
jgi:hypothetical protein